VIEIEIEIEFESESESTRCLPAVELNLC